MPIDSYYFIRNGKFYGKSKHVDIKNVMLK
jgi:hypothetical protein